MSRSDITQLLMQIDGGSEKVVDRILPLVYAELQKLARHHLRSERAGHTLSTTALVHEAYLKLVDQQQVQWRGRGHFFAIASLAMRRILVSHARSRGRLKRGGDREILPLEEGLAAASTERADEIIAVDTLLDQLAGFDERAARVVECRFFGGLTIEETARALGISPMTTKRSWQAARAWMRREIAGKAAGGQA